MLIEIRFESTGASQPNLTPRSVTSRRQGASLANSASSLIVKSVPRSNVSKCGAGNDKIFRMGAKLVLVSGA